MLADLGGSVQRIRVLSLSRPLSDQPKHHGGFDYDADPPVWSDELGNEFRGVEFHSMIDRGLVPSRLWLRMLTEAVSSKKRSACSTSSPIHRAARTRPMWLCANTAMFPSR